MSAADANSMRFVGLRTEPVRDVHGPWQQLAVMGPGEWRVLADQVPLPDGLKWDVRLEGYGVRVPPGANLFVSPETEIARLRAVLDLPALARRKEGV